MLLTLDEVAFVDVPRTTIEFGSIHSAAVPLPVDVGKLNENANIWSCPVLVDT